MLKYLVVQLDDTSVSFCHYKNEKKESRLIELDRLKEAILYAMKENLMVQFIYPNFELPEEYSKAIETIDNCKIAPYGGLKDADVVVINDWRVLGSFEVKEYVAYIIRTNKTDFFKYHSQLNSIIAKGTRLNIVITDIDTFDEQDFDNYHIVLKTLAIQIKNLYANGLSPQLNLLTDRLALDNMNNCNAGWENITLAPNGKFYVCPAFYLEDKESYIGDLTNGLDIKNPQLYRIDHAPLCRKCDAYQCKRCIWLNKKMTLEVNTPSHEQCVIAHLERSSSRSLLSDIRTLGAFLPDKEIKELDYLDPFEKI